MKLSSKRSILAIIGAVAVVILIVYGVVNSSHYTAPKRPPLSQKIIAEKLNSKPAGKSHIVMAKAKPKTPPVSRPVNPPANLVNTGPGGVVAIFSVATLTGTGLFYIRLIYFKQPQQKKSSTFS